MDATIKALRSKGLPPLSYDVVAGELALTRQAVRYHFPETEDLMAAVCDRLAEAYQTALVRHARLLEGRRRLDVFLDFYFNLLDGAPKPADDAAYDAMMSLATGFEAVRVNLRDQYGLLGRVMAQEFEVSHPELSRQAAEELSYLFVCLMYGHWKMVATLGVSDAHNRLTRSAVDRLIRSYQRDGAANGPELRVWSVDR